MKSFRITADHLKLLKNACIEWQNCEFGAPAIDPKRPYGNSYVIGDIAKILGIKLADDGSFSAADIAYMRKVHSELETVLLIMFNVGIAEGEYAFGDFGDRWLLKSEAPATGLFQSQTN